MSRFVAVMLQHKNSVKKSYLHVEYAYRLNFLQLIKSVYSTSSLVLEVLLQKSVNRTDKRQYVTLSHVLMEQPRRFMRANFALLVLSNI